MCIHINSILPRIPLRLMITHIFRHIGSRHRHIVCAGDVVFRRDMHESQDLGRQMWYWVIQVCHAVVLAALGGDVVRDGLATNTGTAECVLLRSVSSALPPLEIPF